MEYRVELCRVVRSHGRGECFLTQYGKRWVAIAGMPGFGRCVNVSAFSSGPWQHCLECAGTSGGTIIIVEGFDMEVEGQGGVKSEASFWDWGGERQQVMVSGVMVKQGSQTRGPGAN